jgi:hypothetical protein
MEIMNPHSSRFAQVSCLFCCVILTQASGLIAAELILQKVPPLTVERAPAYPQNLARYHLGAQVEAAPQANPIESLQLSSNSEDHNIAEAALLCDDPTIGYALPNGSTTLLISLSKIENVDNVAFLNNGAKGELTVAISSAKLPGSNAHWRQVSREELTPDVVKAKIGPSEAKYLKLIFNVTEPGRIAELGVYSTPAVADFTMPRARRIIPDKPENLALVSYNLADVHTKARALYVSSGVDLAEANNMIADQPGTTYGFSGNDASPTAIVDLGKEMAVRRISTIYSPRQGMVDFYVLQSLPGEPAAAPKTLRFNDNALATLKPVGSIADAGAGRAAIDFPPVTGRYIMVKWNLATHQDAAFSVAEIAAFGRTTGSSRLLAANTAANETIETDGKEGKDLGEGKEAKEMPEEGPPAEGPPPSLPDPPPFVFVPEIVPTSP